MPKVSIIIPAYNAEKDIDKCLKSVQEQLFMDYEVIIVNDASEDDTVGSASKWIKKDNRIKLVHNVKKGVSSARNYGIKSARGKYISFLDSDDMLSPIFIQTLVTMMEKSDCECASVAYTVSKDSLEQSADLCKIEYYDDKTCFNILTQLSGGTGGYVWNKMYLASVIKSKDILFDENITAGEDLLFNFNYFQHINKVAFCNANLYYYKLRSNSAINRLDNQKWFELLLVYNNIMNSGLLCEILDKFRYNYAVLILEGLYRSDYCENQYYTIEKLNILKNEYTGLNLKFTFKQNIKILLFHLMPNLSMKFRRRSVGGKL